MSNGKEIRNRSSKVESRVIHVVFRVLKSKQEAIGKIAK